MYSIYFDFDASCENCGRLEPFTVTFYQSGLYFCRFCAEETDREYFKNNFDGERMSNILEKQRQKKIEYYEKRLAKLKEGKGFSN